MSALHDDDTQVLAPVETNGNVGTPKSVLDKIRATRADHAARRTLDLDVPGHDGLVGIRLGQVSGKKLSAIADRLEKSNAPDRAFNVTVDTLSAAIVCVLVRADVADEWDELLDGDGVRVELDARLRDLLGLQGGTQRELLLSLFDGANSPEMAVTGASFAYNQCASTAEQDATQDALGE
jgi:hypothetical protein